MRLSQIVVRSGLQLALTQGQQNNLMVAWLTKLSSSLPKSAGNVSGIMLQQLQSVQVLYFPNGQDTLISTIMASSNQIKFYLYRQTSQIINLPQWTLLCVYYTSSVLRLQI